MLDFFSFFQHTNPRVSPIREYPSPPIFHLLLQICLFPETVFKLCVLTLQVGRSISLIPVIVAKYPWDLVHL